MTLRVAADPSALEAGPWRLSWQKLMMWWFIISDAVLFASMLASYAFNRCAAGSWPDRSRIFDLNYIAAMTFVLITSSATMASAVAASRSGASARAARHLWLTILGGTAFLAMQAYEWKHVIDEGARLAGNPWGVPGFSAYFFAVTGFHGLHVLTGAIILLITTLRYTRGGSSPEGVELAGLYWHFVDLVWVFVFGGFYLL